MKDGRINNKLQSGYVRRYTLTDGKENGIKVVEIDNGILRVLLNESKGLDIMQIWHKGVNMSFVSKNGFTLREIPFLNRFEGGMLYTCGLDAIGAVDGCELHGSYHNLPAKIICVSQSESEICVTAEIEYTALFGQNLHFLRTVTLDTQSGSVMLNDTLSNRGTKTENYCLLYHINLGYPMLDEGVKVVSQTEKVVPRTPYAAEKIAERTLFPAPIDNEEERCYFLQNKLSQISVVNEKLGRRFVLSYSADTLPCMVQWCSPASGDYALGLEPATSFLDGNFEYKKINADESLKFSLKLSFEDIDS